MHYCSPIGQFSSVRLRYVPLPRSVRVFIEPACQKHASERKQQLCRLHCIIQYLHDEEEKFVEGERGEVDAGRTAHFPLHPDAVGEQVARNAERPPEGRDVTVDRLERATAVCGV